MSRKRFADDCDAFEDARAVQDADEGWLINAAFDEIAAGHHDSEIVHEAMKLGHHHEYQELKRLRDEAQHIARAAA